MYFRASRCQNHTKDACQRNLDVKAKFHHNYYHKH